MARGMGGNSPAMVTKHLKGIQFPCDRDELVKHAKKQGADGDVLALIRSMPEGQYANMADVMKGYGKRR